PTQQSGPGDGGPGLVPDPGGQPGDHAEQERSAEVDQQGSPRVLGPSTDPAADRGVHQVAQAGPHSPGTGQQGQQQRAHPVTSRRPGRGTSPPIRIPSPLSSAPPSTVTSAYPSPSSGAPESNREAVSAA